MAKTPTRVTVGRRRKLLRQFEAAKIDALLVMDPANVQYLSGFSGGDSWLVVGPGWAVLLTDSRYIEQAQRECGDIECASRQGSMIQAAKKALTGRNARRVGIESGRVTMNQHAKLLESFGPRRLRATQGLVGALRQVKDAGELAAIRKAVRIAERGFKSLLARGAKGLVGRSEREIAGELEYRMRQLGADGPSFPTIVASGSNAAMPHHHPGSRTVRMGVPLLIDWGAARDGYRSDLTRVIFPGRIPQKIGRIYEVVLRAQLAGIAAIRSGRSGRAVDAAARNVIVAAGYGEQFGHGLGHGVGLAVHEGPGLSKQSNQRLKRGHVVTVEPGIYLPGTGGVRIEDDVLVDAGRAVVLSKVPKQLQAMVLK